MSIKKHIKPIISLVLVLAIIATVLPTQVLAATKAKKKVSVSDKLKDDLWCLETTYELTVKKAVTVDIVASGCDEAVIPSFTDVKEGKWLDSSYFTKEKVPYKKYSIKFPKGKYTFVNTVYTEEANKNLWAALGLSGEPACPEIKLSFKSKEAVLSVKKIETNTWTEKQYMKMLKENFGYEP